MSHVIAAGLTSIEPMQKEPLGFVQSGSRLMHLLSRYLPILVPGLSQVPHLHRSRLFPTSDPRRAPC